MMFFNLNRLKVECVNDLGIISAPIYSKLNFNREVQNGKIFG